MGALQPGLPTPVAIPSGYSKIIIDLKDCFFTIPLHPADRERFAFSLPVTNFKGPMPCFQWKVLPQEMANGPTLCQKYVAQAIDPLHKAWSSIYIVHYMDDILLAGPNPTQLLDCSLQLSQSLSALGLQIAPDKIQLKDPYFYLVFELRQNFIFSQNVQLKTDQLHTLNDFQKFLDNVTWLQPYLKLTTGELKPLFQILEGNPDPSSPRTLIPQAYKALQLINKAIQEQTISFI